MDSTFIFLLLSFIGVVSKYSYVNYIRKDVSRMKTSTLARLRYPAHGSHRGGAGDFGPENTLYNYTRCVRELKTNILEIDLRLTLDGQVVLLHDSSVKRTTNGSLHASAMTLEEIKKLDAGWHYPELRGKGIQIPTLDEVMTEFQNDKNLIFFFDVKQIEVVPMLPKIIEDWKLHDRVIVGAVAADINREIRKTLPKTIPLCPDAITILTYMFLYCIGLEWIFPLKHHMFGMVAMKETARLITPRMIESWKKRNAVVILFGSALDEIESQKQWIKNGCDVVLTDRPDNLRISLASSPSSSENNN
eukprot:TRINITY_DN7798_c0_g1_i2.p1 TRINITY_DN7798_c0_g1~~TRINITY_DN7798_c0_g1_i2.p1  ORF type:complete len:304 (-),score=38.53 TRINITY_DN7798_c0_g1_i2:45-956(-)